MVTVLILAILGAGGYGVYYYFFENKDNSAGRVSSDSEDAVYVDLVSTITGYGSGNGLIDRYGGEVEPQATLEVKLESERTVKECYVKEGDEVKEGQRLFVYDTQEDEDKLAQAEIDIEKAQADIEASEQAIEQYEKEKKTASEDNQLSITTSILTEQNAIKQSEYEIKTNELEIESLKETIASATVTSEMDGIVQKISDSNSSDSYSYGSDSSSVYITILAIGDYRIKGTLNEQNYNQLDVGMPMIVHSRVDDSLTWTGTISEKKDSTDDSDSEEDYYYSYGSDSGSSNYTFYVELDSSEGLMLGQHVYMEPDVGQNDQKDGLWLEEYYIIEEDEHNYVWLANESNLIEKREVTLGEYDEELFKYEILDGLTQEDYIAYPMDSISEGNPVIYNDYSSTVAEDALSDVFEDQDFDNEDYDFEGYEDYDEDYEEYYDEDFDEDYDEEYYDDEDFDYEEEE